MNTDTKARFNAERTAAGYKYLDSLRELMGVGQPVGEGEALERDETAMEKFRRSVGFQFGFVMYSGLDVPAAIDHICASAEVLLAARATQPATAPNDRAIAHRCKDQLRPYPSLLCSMCTQVDESANLSVRDLASRLNTAPTDVAERSRRLAKKIAADKSMRHLMNPASDPIMAHDRLLDRLADIIAEEFK